MTLDIHQILKQLPHRYPFLMVDRVLELEHGKRIKAVKNVSANEPYFLGHFPKRPVMPGVMMIEALAQAAALLSFDAVGASPDDNQIYYFAGIDGARFKRPVEPGDQLHPRRHARPDEGRRVQVHRPGHGRRRARRRGAADLHRAPHRLSGGRAWRRSTRRPSSRPAPSWTTAVSIDAYAIVRQHVRIGAGTTVGPHTLIEGHTTIGRDNRIHQSCSIGTPPQDKKYAGEPTELEIGDRNTIREFCSIHLGTVQDDGMTWIGDDNWIMAYVHIAHDCRVGSQTIIASFAGLAGHVHLGDWAIVGGQSGLHQFVKFGAHAMCAFASHVSQGRAALHDGRRQPARGARLQRRGPAPARLQRRAHRRGEADAQAPLPRRPHVRGGARADRRAGREPARGGGRRAADDDFLADATRGIAR